MGTPEEKLNFKYMDQEDWPRVAVIYGEGLASGHASFQQQVPSWREWDAAHKHCCRILSLKNSLVTGWAALSPVSSRQVYGGVAEVSLYVAKAFQGQKIGSHLLAKLIMESEENNIWTLQASIFPENKASIQVHKNHGFRIIGYREKIGLMKGEWRDTILLERRSKKIGRE